LVDLKELRSLSLVETGGVTAEGVRELKKVLPALLVESSYLYTARPMEIFSANPPSLWHPLWEYYLGILVFFAVLAVPVVILQWCEKYRTGCRRTSAPDSLSKSFLSMCELYRTRKPGGGR
jgi:hypothetical protein